MSQPAPWSQPAPANPPRAPLAKVVPPVQPKLPHGKPKNPPPTSGFMADIGQVLALVDLIDMDELATLASKIRAAKAASEQWNSHSLNQRGRLLETYMDRHNFDVIAPMTPTHYPHTVGHRPDILDIALLKGITLRLRSIVTVHELDSDHRPVVLSLGPSPLQESESRTVLNWDKLEKSLESPSSPELDSIPDTLTSPEHIDRAISSLTNHLQNVTRDASRQVPALEHERWRLPEDLQELVREKNAATRAYDSTPSEPNRVRLRALQSDVKQRISEHRNDRWANLMEGISPSHQAYWTIARALKSDTVSDLPPLTRTGRPPALDDSEKAECLADVLELQCSPSNLSVDHDHISMVDQEIARRTDIPPSDTLTPTTHAEVKEVIKGLKPKKAPGLDGISNRVLKLLPDHLIALLVVIFNAAMANCIFPDTWKEAAVIGIHKPSKARADPSSYRPISLLKTMGKLYEILLLRRLKEFAFSKGLIPDTQFGFRAKHSCIQQVHRITEYILEGFTHKNQFPTGALFFDVAKAFDKVWHNGLLYKLFVLGVPDRLVLIIRDFLAHRSFRYRVEGTLSSSRPIHAGVPQGSVLSPLLFTLFTSDFPKLDPKVQVALFADDTAIYFKDRNKSRISRVLQAAANTLGDWFRQWRIEVNPEKSAAMLFARGGSPRPTDITMFGQPIPWSKTTKYLGVTLDDRLTFGPHITRVRNTAVFVMGRLAPLLNKRRSKMPLRHKVTLYKTCIRPILTYASVVFAQAAKTNIRKLQVIQNRFMRRATGAPWYMRNVDLHADLELPSIIQFMKEASERHFEQAAHHPNPLVVHASEYTPDPNADRRRPKNVLCDPPDHITRDIATRPPRPNTHTNRHRLRRRRRGNASLPISGAYRHYRHVPGRFSPTPQPRSDGLSRGPCPMGALRPRAAQNSSNGVLAVAP